MKPQRMEIVVDRRVGPSLRAALGDYEVVDGADGRTTIVGVLVDQAQLFGLLDMLESLNIEVVSVNPVDA